MTNKFTTALLAFAFTLLFTSLFTAPVKAYGTNIVARTSILNLSENPTEDKLSTQGWKWDSSTSTLFLNGANINVSQTNEYYTAVLLPKNSTIIINGENFITYGTDKYSYAIYCQGDGDLTIKGSGSLTATSGELTYSFTETMSAGIYVNGNLHIKSGTINAVGGDASNGYVSCGIFSKSLYVSGGSLTSTSGNFDESSGGGSFGICLDEHAKPIFSGGTTKVTAFSDEANNIYGRAFKFELEDIENNFQSNFQNDVGLTENTFPYFYLFEATTGKTKYTATFHKNDGSLDFTTQTFLHAQPEPLNANTFALSGYSFSGWSTDPNGLDTPYSGGQTVSLTGNLDFYAQWEASINKSAVISGSPSLTALTEGTTSFTLSTSNVLTGTTFKVTGLPTGVTQVTAETSGDNTKVILAASSATPFVKNSELGVVFSDDNIVTTGTVNLTMTKKQSEPFQVVTSNGTFNEIYIICEGFGKLTEANFNITFNGEPVNISSVSAYTGERYILTTEPLDGDNNKKLSVKMQGELTNYLPYEETVTITPTAIETVNAETPVLLYNYDITTFNYFTGEEAIELNALSEVSDGGQLTYQWYVNDVNISIGGLPIEENGTCASYTPSTNASGTAYYYCVVTNTNEEVTGLKTASVKTVVFTVNVADEANTFLLNFEANEGTGTMSPQQFTAGISQPIWQNSFTRSRYRFESWNTAVDGSGTRYSDCQSITLYSNLTLYAQWVIHSPSSAPSNSNSIITYSNAKINTLNENISVEDTIKNAEIGTTVNVFLNTETSVPKSVFEAAKDKNINVVLNFKNYSWAFNGTSVKLLNNSLNEYNLAVNTIKSTQISNLSEGKEVLQLNLAHNGALPFKGVLTYPVNNKLNSKTLYLSYFNPVTNRLEYSGIGTVEKGNVKLEFSHASQYILSETVLSGTFVNKEFVGADNDIYTYVPYFTDAQSGDNSLVKQSTVNEKSVSFVMQDDGYFYFKNNKKNFKDTSTHWAKNAISYITSREIFYGTGDEIFDPNKEMTRAMFVTVSAKLDNALIDNYTVPPFEDFSVETWYGKYVAWAYDTGLLGFIESKTFEPNKPITREEAAYILDVYISKMETKPSYSYNVPYFADISGTSEFAQNSVMNMRRYGIFSGIGDNLFLPKENISRASAAQILMNFICASVK